jgi:hypothetical protein
MATTEDKLSDVLNEIALTYSDYKRSSSPSGKIDIYNKCNNLISVAKRLIEELKIDIINMDSNTDKATRRQLDQANLYIELAQLPAFDFNQQKQIIVELKEIYKGIPTGTTVIDNVHERQSDDGDIDIFD